MGITTQAVLSVAKLVGVDDELELLYKISHLLGKMNG